MARTVDAMRAQVKKLMAVKRIFFDEVDPRSWQPFKPLLGTTERTKKARILRWLAVAATSRLQVLRLQVLNNRLITIGRTSRKSGRNAHIIVPMFDYHVSTMVNSSSGVWGPGYLMNKSRIGTFVSLTLLGSHKFQSVLRAMSTLTATICQLLKHWSYK